jgi:hypothetical protein
MARPERFELPTAWFVVFRLKSHISLYYIAFMRLALSNKNGLFGLIRLYLGLFEAIYWTVKSVGRTTRKGINGHKATFPGFQLRSQMQHIRTYSLIKNGPRRRLPGWFGGCRQPVEPAPHKRLFSIVNGTILTSAMGPT